MNRQVGLNPDRRRKGRSMHGENTADSAKRSVFSSESVAILRFHLR